MAPSTAPHTPNGASPRGATAAGGVVHADQVAAAPHLSLVVPVFNERDNVVPLHESISWALRDLAGGYEVLLVDDGSRDGTREVIRTLARKDPCVRAVLLRRNYGQTAAMAAGFDRARGKVIAAMDGDLQNDPSDLPRLLEMLDRGFDVVCGWRRHRQDRVTTRLLPSRVANLMIRRFTGVKIHDTGCSLKVYRSWVVRSLTLYSDMHRFMAALGAGVGARVTELPVRHHARRHGRSKYGLGRIFRVLGDLLVIKMLIQFSAHPIRWFGLAALPLFLLAPVLFALGCYEYTDGSLRVVDLQEIDVTDFATAGVALLVALNVFLLGFLAELQVQVSRLFRRRSVVAAREASR